ncbi:DUF1801 domain-containing protein [Epibacterium sp. Ofav1-8]|uniref:DUF1801 domain-containing protein n=1 Tax=Epibacterium sp. Ofav1-8 TaxID=2917735 RepID=UPI001EF6047E|nr:DUF1801 domain-containing protein [Epibacterium sp. Ofav1-8]MCG7622670.1 DUF1801 domain-containing protein [Epibacterium sp. Ofav1-8]
MLNATPPFLSPAVAGVFAAYPEPERQGLLALRRMIFETAAEIPAVGRLDETLKWGQPAYLTPDSKSGSTIRLGRPKGGGFALYTNCQTTLMSDFQALFPETFRYEGNRAIHFLPDSDPPVDVLRLLVRNALTYHLK